MVESAADEILAGAHEVDVAFLVVGDPFGYDLAYPGEQAALTFPGQVVCCTCHAV